MLTVRICVGALMSEKVEDSDVRLYNTRSSTRREPPLEENECGGVVRDLVPSGGARHPRISFSAASTSVAWGFTLFSHSQSWYVFRPKKSHSKSISLRTLSLPQTDTLTAMFRSLRATSTIARSAGTFISCAIAAKSALATAASLFIWPYH